MAKIPTFGSTRRNLNVERRPTRSISSAGIIGQAVSKFGSDVQQAGKSIDEINQIQRRAKRESDLTKSSTNFESFLIENTTKGRSGVSDQKSLNKYLERNNNDLVKERDRIAKDIDDVITRNAFIQKTDRDIAKTKLQDQNFKMNKEADFAFESVFQANRQRQNIVVQSGGDFEVAQNKLLEDRKERINQEVILGQSGIKKLKSEENKYAILALESKISSGSAAGVTEAEMFLDGKMGEFKELNNTLSPEKRLTYKRMIASAKKSIENGFKKQVKNKASNALIAAENGFLDLSNPDQKESFEQLKIQASMTNDPDLQNKVAEAEATSVIKRQFRMVPPEERDLNAANPSLYRAQGDEFQVAAFKGELSKKAKQISDSLDRELKSDPVGYFTKGDRNLEPMLQQSLLSEDPEMFNQYKETLQSHYDDFKRPLGNRPLLPKKLKEDFEGRFKLAMADRTATALTEEIDRVERITGDDAMAVFRELGMKGGSLTKVAFIGEVNPKFRRQAAANMLNPEKFENIKGQQKSDLLDDIRSHESFESFQNRGGNNTLNPANAELFAKSQILPEVMRRVNAGESDDEAIEGAWNDFLNYDTINDPSNNVDMKVMVPRRSDLGENFPQKVRDFVAFHTKESNIKALNIRSTRNINGVDIDLTDEDINTQVRSTGVWTTTTDNSGIQLFSDEGGVLRPFKNNDGEEIVVTWEDIKSYTGPSEDRLFDFTPRKGIQLFRGF